MAHLQLLTKCADIMPNETNLLTKFQEDWTINEKKAPPPGGHVFKATQTIFKLNKDIFEINLLVLTRFNYSHIGKNALSPGSHVFQPTSIIFELVQDIIGNLLTKFHEDWTINVASK
ncbi:hypothetical protein DPMN_166868 [Dreissena polymorpha]|uniref:Uncharacterized protein n=1 Tax=Dreissena polymorpha TaxID=45954 RepID=A0A9D4IVV0_DREPO|nr:hypothetical protein DPMN_166868 [Dreissena polymorpha]